MSGSVHREERRLSRIFQRALWIAVAAPIAAPMACATVAPIEATEPEPEDDAPLDSPEPAAPGETGSGGDGPVSGVELEPEALAGELEATAKMCAPVSFTPNPPDRCGNYVRLPCGLPKGVTPGTNCYLWLNDCQKICPGAYFNCRAVGDSCKDGEIVKDSKGAIEIDCATCAKGVGRIPAGLARATVKRASSPLGDYFASAAHLEAAAVHAFRRLHDELAASGAPPRLLRAARRAQRDEVRHVRVTARLARRFGGTPAPARVSQLPLRALDAVALENAVEGCVRETFGALFASFQAANALDSEIAQAMDVIARDETRHAALSWAIARWAARRLDPAARARIAARCREAVEALRREADSRVPAELTAQAGVPTAAQQRAMVDALEEQLWSCWAA